MIGDSQARPIHPIDAPMSRLCSSTCMVTLAASTTYTAETTRASISRIPGTFPPRSACHKPPRTWIAADGTAVLPHVMPCPRPGYRAPRRLIGGVLACWCSVALSPIGAYGLLPFRSIPHAAATDAHWTDPYRMHCCVVAARRCVARLDQARPHRRGLSGESQLR